MESMPAAPREDEHPPDPLGAALVRGLMGGMARWEGLSEAQAMDRLQQAAAGLGWAWLEPGRLGGPPLLGGLEDFIRILAALRAAPRPLRLMALRGGLEVALLGGTLPPSQNLALRGVQEALALAPGDLVALFRDRTGGEIPPPRDPAHPDLASSGDPMARLRALALLGLEEGAGAEEVRRAFHRISKVHHPDHYLPHGPEATQEATLAFRRIKEAYDFLLPEFGREAGDGGVRRAARELAEIRARLGLPGRGAAVRPPSPSEDPGPGDPPRAGGAPVLPWLGGVAGALVVLGLLAWWGQGQPSGPPDSGRPSEGGLPRDASTGGGPSGLKPAPDPAPPGPKEEALPLPPPEHGWIQGALIPEPGVPWRIRTDPGQDYLVSLVDAQTQAVVLTLFLQGGKPYLGRAPVGEFEVVHTTGTRWFGPQLGFGPGARVVRSERIHRLQGGRDDSWIWELRLHPTSGEAAAVDSVNPRLPLSFR